MNTEIGWLSDEQYEQIVTLTPIPGIDLVIINNNYETLLVERRAGAYQGSWCTIGGRIRLGETLKNTIDRQAAELGVKVDVIFPFNPTFPAFVNDRWQDPTKHTMCNVYPVRIRSGELLPEGPEFTSTRWFHTKSLPENIGYDHRHQIQEVLRRIKI